MRTYHHSLHILRESGIRHAMMYKLGSMIFFWSIFDCILMYILPVLISQHGFSTSEMGMIIGSSSFTGAVFDFLLSKYIRSPHFRKLYFFVLIFSGLFLIILYMANTILIFLLAMALWGIYWDIFHFANFDFVSRTVPEREHSQAFGVMGVFQSLGIMVAPLLAGFLIGSVIDFKPFLLSGVMLGLSSILFLIVITGFKKSNSNVVNVVHPSRNWSREFSLWFIIGKQLAPLLMLTLMIFIVDAFFWTIGPLIAENGGFGKFGGLFLLAYSFPTLIMGWFVGKISDRFGKKRTALYALLIGSGILSFFMFAQNPIEMILLVGIASSFIGISFPSISGAYADYISETQLYEKEIQGVIDIFYNIGWIVGPILAGFLAQDLGNSQSFSVLGLFSMLICIVLLINMPRKIRLKLHS